MNIVFFWIQSIVLVAQALLTCPLLSFCHEAWGLVGSVIEIRKGHKLQVHFRRVNKSASPACIFPSQKAMGHDHEKCGVD
jgi:hypothetical protein